MMSKRRAEATHSDMDAIYAERNAAALAFAGLAVDLGWAVGTITDPLEPDWPVLIVETPRGQVSWHLQRRELPEWLKPHRHDWDGHTTPEKNRRLARLIHGGAVSEGGSHARRPGPTTQEISANPGLGPVD